jgi:hypothetical protein
MYNSTYTQQSQLAVFPIDVALSPPSPTNSLVFQPPRAAAIPSHPARPSHSLHSAPSPNQRLFETTPLNSLQTHASLPLRTIHMYVYMRRKYIQMTLSASPPFSQSKRENSQQTEGAPHSTEIYKARGRAGVGRNNRYGSGCRSSGGGSQSCSKVCT